MPSRLSQADGYGQGSPVTTFPGPVAADGLQSSFQQIDSRIQLTERANHALLDEAVRLQVRIDVALCVASAHVQCSCLLAR